MKKKFINIHHTSIFANDDTSEQFLSVDDYHKKKWGGKTRSKMGFYGGYHYLIERSGYVAQFRNEWEVGAHNNKKLMNYKAIGIAFAGNMSRQYLSDEQVNAGVQLIKDIQARLGIPDNNIKPHRLYRATQCPGNNFADPVWDYLQELYDKITDGKEDWKKGAVKWAKEKGISNGERPNDPVTRAEVMQMLKNYDKQINHNQ